MSIVSLNEVLIKARKEKYAVGNFDCFNFEMVKGVLKAANELKAPVIIAYGEPFIVHMDMPYYVNAIKEMAEEAKVPVVLHTDHFTKTENIKRAIDCGFTSVMIDASDKEYQENVAVTEKVVEMAHQYGVSVESELGHVSGLGDIFEDDSNVFTKPEIARDFVTKTGIDALAVSIGNVHGVYKAEPKLRFDILEEIANSVSLPLVLHGASGIPESDIRKAVSMGITKVNYYTDMCLAACDKMMKYPSAHLFEHCETITEECYRIAYEKMVVLQNK